MCYLVIIPNHLMWCFQNTERNLHFLLSRDRVFSIFPPAPLQYETVVTGHSVRWLFTENATFTWCRWPTNKVRRLLFILCEYGSISDFVNFWLTCCLPSGRHLPGCPFQHLPGCPMGNHTLCAHDIAQPFLLNPLPPSVWYCM